jgi:pantoate--beta-alanine ligase
VTAQPVLASSREELHSALGMLAGQRRGQIGFAPTMGALHDGHAALIRRTRAEVDGPVVVSIFVNPTQFAPGEDLDRYPRTLPADLEVCAAAGADVVFAPSVEDLYPDGATVGSASGSVSVDPGPLGSVLEGAARPTHFRGVLTVVAKLFGLVRPEVAVFGQKDYQQLVLIRRMAVGLCQGVDVLGAETTREPDGLALSSRNRYLDPDQRRTAGALSRALFAGRDAASQGTAAATEAAHAVLRGTPGLAVDYLALTDPELGPAPVRGPARLLVAARLGSTRLIDNVGLELGGRS